MMVTYPPLIDPLILWQEEPHTHPHAEDLTEFSPSPSSLSDHSSAPRATSSDVDSPAEVSLERSHRSFIGLSEKELLKCAFSSTQSEGATESPEINGEQTILPTTMYWCINRCKPLSCNFSSVSFYSQIWLRFTRWYGIRCQRFLEVRPWKGEIPPFANDDV